MQTTARNSPTYFRNSRPRTQAVPGFSGAAAGELSVGDLTRSPRRRGQAASVANRKTYPNLAALFGLLRVPTQESDMSFAVSMDGGALEYSGSGLWGVFAQPRNLFRPRMWSMLADLARFY